MKKYFIPEITKKKYHLNDKFKQLYELKAEAIKKLYELEIQMAIREVLGNEYNRNFQYSYGIEIKKSNYKRWTFRIISNKHIVERSIKDIPKVLAFEAFKNLIDQSDKRFAASRIRSAMQHFELID
jgi:hypothetical protein